MLAALKHFINTYAFLSQTVSFADTGLERDYLYDRALAAVLPGQQAARLDRDLLTGVCRGLRAWQISALPSAEQ